MEAARKAVIMSGGGSTSGAGCAHAQPDPAALDPEGALPSTSTS